MEVERRLRRLESHLGAEARWIVEQHCLHTRSFAEIGRELGVSAQTVARGYKKGLAVLRALWDDSD
jgi:DNA-directed RNA polymerase specialized sigma24 family protein